MDLILAGLYFSFIQYSAQPVLPDLPAGEEANLLDGPDLGKGVWRKLIIIEV
jgi:hypothetical protein